MATIQASAGGTTTGTPTGSAVERRRMRPGRWFTELGWRHVVGVVAVVYAAFPLVYVLSASLSENGTLTGSNALFADVSGANYAELGTTTFWTWMANTLVIAVATSAGTVLMGAAAAYAFSRFRFAGRRAGLTSLLVVQMFPQMLAFVAIFLLLLGLGAVVPALGLDSKVALVAVYLGGALGVNTFLMYGFFNTVPRELDEAAKIDGATHTQIYWTIVLRLVAPILAVVGLLAFISTFGEFIIARIVLPSESSWTIAVGLYGWVSSLKEANWGLFTAGAVVSALPVLALFLYLQKYIVGGLTAGAVKG
jgi:arabinogalactan oligomer/maltooligosaccharide transport system permease protein